MPGPHKHFLQCCIQLLRFWIQVLSGALYRYTLSIFAAMARLVFFCLLFTLCFTAFSQKNRGLVRVEGRAEMLLEDASCIGSAKQQVVDLAKINALEKAFGKAIVQGTSTYIKNTSIGEDAETTTVMNVLANSTVNGEFIEEEVTRLEWILRDKPTSTTDMQQELWLVCEVRGKARALETGNAEFEVLALNCPGADCQTKFFRNNDRLYIQFQAAVDGYLSIFMKDFEEDVVYRLLPYQKMPVPYEHAVPVKKDTKYIFFSEEHHQQQFADLPLYVLDPVSLGTNEEQLFNRMYIVFSDVPFNKPLLQSKAEFGYLKTSGFENFQKWLNKNRAQTKGFQVDHLDVVIKK